MACRENASHRPHGFSNPDKMLLCIRHGAKMTAAFVFINISTSETDIYSFLIILQVSIKPTESKLTMNAPKVKFFVYTTKNSKLTAVFACVKICVAERFSLYSGKHCAKSACQQMLVVMRIPSGSSLASSHETTTNCGACVLLSC